MTKWPLTVIFEGQVYTRITEENYKQFKDRPERHIRQNKNYSTKVYTAWASMKDRCNNQNSRSYYLYGARGIRICERWGHFENFLADMGEPPSPSHSLDRIDNYGHYAPSNCRWATKKEQTQNRRPRSEWPRLIEKNKGEITSENAN